MSVSQVGTIRTISWTIRAIQLSVEFERGLRRLRHVLLELGEVEYMYGSIESCSYILHVR